MFGGAILRDPNGSNRSDSTDTAVNLVASVLGCEVGSSFEFYIDNTANSAETITLTAGSGVTLNGTMTIEQNDARTFLVVFTNIFRGSEAITIYDRGSLAGITTSGKVNVTQLTNINTTVTANAKSGIITTHK